MMNNDHDNDNDDDDNNDRILHTAAAAPIPASSRPFSLGPSLKYSIVITAPIDCINITGRKAAIRATNKYINLGILNNANVFPRPDLFWFSKSVEGN